MKSMDQYVEIRIAEPCFVSTAIVMSSLFERVHHLIVEKRVPFGLSFPEYGSTLGAIMRIHFSTGSWSEEIVLSLKKGGLGALIRVTEPARVPVTSRYVCVKRIQPKTNPERLLRRSLRKGWISYEEMQERLNASQAVKIEKPFVRLKSRSTGEKFHIFLEQSVQEGAGDELMGEFNSYGLSQRGGRLPWF